MNILLLGATGFIGAAVAHALVANGHAVTGLARDPGRMRNQLKSLAWVTADLRKLTQAKDWTQLLAGQHVVVNCAGALQTGLHDDVEASQQAAMLALYEAAKQQDITRIVQISANTEDAGADTDFLRTKRAADQALAASGLPHVILRPALVLGRNAFGGTALLRALASMPGAIPLTFADNRVATVSLDDVAEWVAKAVAGELGDAGDHDLAADPITFRNLVALHRDWLGLPPAPIVTVPAALAIPLSRLADFAGRLGWRSPLRSTAMTVMAGGVTVRHLPEQAAKPQLATAAKTLASHPSGIQDLWFARLYLLKAPIFLVLSLFWLLSGLIPLLGPGRAAAFLAPFMPESAALLLTFLTCAVDIALGLTVLFRPWSHWALFGMFAVAATYLAAGTLLTPALWLDPLGPFVKVLPSILLSLVALAILEER